ncbi:putative Pectin lyase-like superfamily protein [Hibiscus syriacus]|uniref:Pectin lyase-like superfamily protein n=1 Tax=Hibiscus syriacus TaxID=106335 RepID=A0A6A2Y6H9_HIBSY|nr:VQ motif-containing protein 10-like [Hibiscus syriacus]KAE8680060.1 putative Pectin lyase-like superfamily protein [Hibiscus syriacus]
MSKEREPVKVVIINTKYVETDATSFKSVVQELTGKDSEVTSNPLRRRSRFYHEEINKKEVQVARVGSASSRSGEFKEFERLLKEMPPADDLWWRME